MSGQSVFFFFFEQRLIIESFLKGQGAFISLSNGTVKSLGFAWYFQQMKGEKRIDQATAAYAEL